MKKPILLFLMLASFAFVAAQAQQPEYGQASFYDDSFQGSMTAYNVKYDKNQLTASHKIYPFGTLLRVTRLDNKKSVVVKVIDKGPYIKGRIVDLSRKAAEQLDIVKDGVANVKVELYRKAVSTSDLEKATAEKQPAKTPPAPEELPAGYDKTPQNTPKKTSVAVKNDQPTQPKSTTSASSTKTTTTKSKTTEKSGAAKVHLVKQDYTQYGLYKIQLERPEKKGFGVQVSALTNYDSVLRQIANLQAKSFDNILVSIEKGSKNQTTYKIILGPQDSEAAANSYKKSLKSRYKMNGFVVDLSTLTY